MISNLGQRHFEKIEAPMANQLMASRVNKPENDDPSILEPIKLATFAA
jgi:hypothetical protein